MEINEAVASLGALAQESRLRIFRLLVEAGPEGLAAGEIALELGLPGATLSFHLKELTNAELCTSERFGRSIVYAADYRRMQRLVNYLSQNCCRRRVRRRS